MTFYMISDLFLMQILVYILKAACKLMRCKMQKYKSDPEDLRVVQVVRQKNLFCIDVLLIKAN